MSPEDRVRLRHVADGLDSAIPFTRGRKREDLDRDEMLVFALMHAFQIAGEAAARIRSRVCSMARYRRPNAVRTR
jgi:uncharacterized protein with HEPN domain